MRFAMILLVLSPLLAADQAMAQAASGRVGIRLHCDGPETSLVSMLAYERDRGTPKAAMLARAERLPENDGTRLIAVSRVEHVYLDPALKPATLVAFRSKLCQIGLLQRDHATHAEMTRTALLQCQSLGTPGDRAFRDCIHALAGELETRFEAAGQP